MKALILAGGFGRRLERQAENYTNTKVASLVMQGGKIRPKGLVIVEEKPLVGWQLSQLERAGIERSNIYSGQDFIAKEIKEGKMNPPFYYTNCGTGKSTNAFHKSDVIKMLKETNQTEGKIIHIGDGENDLEVWKTKQCDVFIGFGVNYIDKKVKKEAPVFVESMEEFKKEIEKILQK